MAFQEEGGTGAVRRTGRPSCMCSDARAGGHVGIPRAEAPSPRKPTPGPGLLMLAGVASTRVPRPLRHPSGPRPGSKWAAGKLSGRAAGLACPARGSSREAQLLDTELSFLTV